MVLTIQIYRCMVGYVFKSLGIKVSYMEVYKNTKVCIYIYIYIHGKTKNVTRKIF